MMQVATFLQKELNADMMRKIMYESNPIQYIEETQDFSFCKKVTRHNILIVFEEIIDLFKTDFVITENYNENAEIFPLTKNKLVNINLSKNYDVKNLYLFKEFGYLPLIEFESDIDINDSRTVIIYFIGKFNQSLPKFEYFKKVTNNVKFNRCLKRFSNQYEVIKHNISDIKKITPFYFRWIELIYQYENNFIDLITFRQKMKEMYKAHFCI